MLHKVVPIITAMKNEIFKEVSKADMPKVLEALTEDWPKHFILKQLIATVEEYKAAKTDWEFTLYVYGDYNSGVYLHKTFVKRINRYWFHIYTKELDFTSLQLCLNKTEIIPWNGDFSFYIIHRRFQEHITAMFKIQDIIHKISENTTFYFPAEKNLDIQPLPDDVYIDFLDRSYADEMNATWPHRSPHSEQILKVHLEINFGLGLFNKSDRKMLSSALSNQTGGIFVLYTNPLFRGKGYGKFIVQHMVKEVRQRGRIPFCTVVKSNTPSEVLFKRVGFETFSDCDYIFPQEKVN